MSIADLPERGVRRFDDYQQHRWWVAHPVGVVRKYADDRGSALAGLVTFQVFLGMLPLLVVVLTLLGRILSGSEDLRRAALDSTLAQFPVLGDRIAEDVSTVAVSGPWVAISIGGLLWTSAGIYHSLQLALNQVWNVEGVHRQGWVSRHVRAVVLFALVVSAAIGTGFLRGADPLRLGRGFPAGVLSGAVSVLIASVLLLAVFRIAVSPAVPLRALVPAAAVAGPLWELLQRVGAWIVLDRLGQAQDLYGAIGFVVVTLFWINLLARAAVFANEAAVVTRRRLWPRRIAQPPLTDADRRVLAALVRNERRRPEQHVEVHFDDAADDEADEDADQETDEVSPGDRERPPNRRGATSR
jgi:YihY family inner membrane protein